MNRCGARWRDLFRSSTAYVLFTAILLSARTHAQNADWSMGLESTYPAEFLADLPTSDNLFVVLETIQPSLISDRFSGGGLYTGQPSRIGGFLGSWSQTLFRVGDVNVTDSTGSGAPLLFPDLMFWHQIGVATASMPVDVNAAGLAVTLEPLRPTPQVAGAIHGVVSHFGLEGGTPRTAAPAIARLNGWDRVAAFASGPVIPDRVGAVVAATLTQGSQFSRDERSPVDASVRSALTQLVLTPGGSDEIRALGWLQSASSPFEYRGAFGQPDASTTETAAHLQATWRRRGQNVLPWRVFGGYTRRRRTPEMMPGVEGPALTAASGASVILERLRDGPVSDIAAISTGIVDHWSIGARLTPSPTLAFGRTHTAEAGIELGRHRSQAFSFLSGNVGELVDSIPARLWRFSHPGVESHRRELAIALHASDRIDLARRVALDVGLRVDALTGSADGAPNDVRWRTWMPRARVRWTVTDRWQTVVFAGYARSAYRLALDLLAIGDPAAPIADVFRWNRASGGAGADGPLVARAGPGTGGDSAFSALDPDLKRPTADEVVIGVNVRPRESLRLGLVGISRRERNLIGLVNIGAPDSAYSRFTIADPGADLLGSQDDRLVSVYDRLPATFGRDRYLLTNPSHEDATFDGLEASIQVATERFVLRGGATAAIAVASAANRGFGPLENDQSLAGELFANPNAATFARGRLFNDRAYTVKLAGVYKFPADVRLGAVARYQDGQPFARLLVFPNLNQGAEAVRAFPNGDSRFTFTGTLDVRLQKGFTFGGRRIAVLLDAYNVLNLANEVEERVTAAPDVRIATAVQPPRTFHIGVRATF
jgi:hypothetical protein